MGSNPNTTESLKEAKARARNAMDKQILRLCEIACRDLPAPEGKSCIALGPKLKDKFTTPFKAQVSGPDIDRNDTPVMRKIDIDRGSKIPWEGKIDVTPPDKLPDGGNTAAHACAEVECRCSLNMN